MSAAPPAKRIGPNLYVVPAVAYDDTPGIEIQAGGAHWFEGGDVSRLRDAINEAADWVALKEENMIRTDAITITDSEGDSLTFRFDDDFGRFEAWSEGGGVIAYVEAASDADRLAEFFTGVAARLRGES